MFRYEQPLLFTSSGHYVVPICQTIMEVEDVKTEVVRKEFSIIALAETSLKEKENIVWKLHWQFCHCSAEKLKRLIY